MGFPEVVIGRAADILKGTFIVAKTKLPITEDETLFPDNLETQFKGDDSLASAWTGWGLIRKNIVDGKQSAIVCSKEELPELPK